MLSTRPLQNGAAVASYRVGVGKTYLPIDEIYLQIYASAIDLRLWFTHAHADVCAPKEGKMTLQVGDWVEVRSKAEILRSLDSNGRLEKLPLMPEMFEYCGQRFQVYKRAHKTCDTVNPSSAGRRLTNAVHLELRCDGKAHGGCQTACLIFWKEAWLKPVNEATTGKASLPDDTHRRDKPIDETGCTEEIVWTSACTRDPQSKDGKRYFCQATELPDFTAPLQWWDMRQYVEDYTSGNLTMGRLVRGFIYASYSILARKNKFGIGVPFRWLYDQFQALVGGVPYPRRDGAIPADHPTPHCSLDLQPGELVRVKSYPEILATLNTGTLKNGGMMFDAELVPYCGRVYRVKARVERFLSEKTGRMMSLKTPPVILDGVWCQARYSYFRMGCPRCLYSWWREIWLERVNGPNGNSRS